MFPLAHMGLPLVPFLFSRNVPKWAPLMAFGGLLPDIIDKPLGHLILPENNGRIFAHTLLFAISLVALGLTWKPMMAVAYGAIVHHLLDFVYLEPTSTLWPLYGAFPTTDFSYTTWIDHLLQPLNFLGEAAGLALLIWWTANYVLKERGPSKTIYN